MLEESEKTATTKTSNSNKRFNKALEKSDLKKDHRKATSVSKFTKKSDSPKKHPLFKQTNEPEKQNPRKKENIPVVQELENKKQLPVSLNETHLPAGKDNKFFSDKMLFYIL